MVLNRAPQHRLPHLPVCAFFPTLSQLGLSHAVRCCWQTDPASAACLTPILFTAHVNSGNVVEVLTKCQPSDGRSCM